MAQSYLEITKDPVQFYLFKRFGFLPAPPKGHGTCLCGHCLVMMSARFKALEHRARELRRELGLPFRKLHRAMQIGDLEAEVHACVEVLLVGFIHTELFLYSDAVSRALARRAERGAA